MRRVHCNSYYNLDNVTISEDNIKKRRVFAYLISMKIELLIIKFDEEKELVDLAY